MLPLHHSPEEDLLDFPGFENGRYRARTSGDSLGKSAHVKPEVAAGVAVVEVLIVDGPIRLYGRDFDAALTDDDTVLQVNRQTDLAELVRIVFELGVQAGVAKSEGGAK